MEPNIKPKGTVTAGGVITSQRAARKRANRLKYAEERTLARMHCQKVVRQWNSRETAEEREELAPALREAMDKEDEAWKAIPSYVSWKERREQGDLQAVVVLPPYPSWPKKREDLDANAVLRHKGETERG